jgi:hypothetical protein
MDVSGYRRKDDARDLEREADSLGPRLQLDRSGTGPVWIPGARNLAQAFESGGQVMTGAPSMLGACRANDAESRHQSERGDDSESAYAHERSLPWSWVYSYTRASESCNQGVRRSRFEGEQFRVNEHTVGTNVGETSNLKAGATNTITIDLEAGHYVFMCNLPAHYGLGMHTDFTVA